jgi:hypothetical protein
MPMHDLYNFLDEEMENLVKKGLVKSVYVQQRYIGQIVIGRVSFPFVQARYHHIQDEFVPISYDVIPAKHRYFWNI